jgi:hypothetical protein
MGFISTLLIESFISSNRDKSLGLLILETNSLSPYTGLYSYTLASIISPVLSSIHLEASFHPEAFHSFILT